MCDLKNSKMCFRCNNTKTLDKFSINKKSKDGLYSYCKDCRKQYRKDNLEKIKIYDESYSKTDNFKKSQKKFKNENKDTINLYRRKYRKEVLLNDPLFILKSAIRDTIRHRLKFKGIPKKETTLNILGCSFDEFKIHIEKLWSHPNNLDDNGNVWMNWHNYGNPKDGIYQINKTWDLDHIIPISSAKNDNEVFELNRFSNFQPLCSYINRFIKKHYLIF
jgi:hypothetical protein